MTKNILQRLLFWIMLCVLLIACENDIQPDVTKPTINLRSDLKNNVLTGVIHVSVLAMDNDQIDKLLFFVSGNLVKEVIGESLEFDWDTNSVPDALHEFKFLATDKNGNSGELIVLGRVRNTLFKFSVDPNYLDRLKDPLNPIEIGGWVFIIDNAGKVLFTEEIIGNEITIRPFEGLIEGQTFTLGILDYRLLGSGYQEFDFHTYSQIDPGIYILKKNLARFQAPIGQHSINLIKSVDAPISAAGGFGYGVINSEFNAGQTNVSIAANLIDSPTDVYYYVTKSSKQPYYTKLSMVESGESTTIELDDLTPMDYNTINLPNSEYTYYALGFIPALGDYANVKYIYQYNEYLYTTQINFYYPVTDFHEYLSKIAITADGSYQEYSYVGATPVAGFESIDGKVNRSVVTNGKITLEMTGDSQFLRLRSRENINNGVVIWSVYGNRSDYILPQIPSSLLEVYPILSEGVLKFDEVTLYEYSGIDSYSEWFDIKFKLGESYFEKSKTQKSKTFSF